MKRIILCFALVSFVCCSTNDDDNEVECRLSSYNTIQLYYEFLDRNTLGAVYNYDFNFEGIEIEYNNGKIKKIIGGPIPIPAGQNLVDWTITNLVEYSVEYSGNNVTITSAIESFYGDTSNDFTIVEDKIINRNIIIPQGLINEKVYFEYEYEENKVLEYKNGNLFRTFYFVNNNLVTIEELIYFDVNNPLEESDILHSKYEIVFSEFDNLTNELKNKFFIDGAFYKAFSKNNYHKIELKTYTFNQDTQEFEYNDWSTNSRSYSIGTNDDGSSGLFTIYCLE